MPFSVGNSNYHLYDILTFPFSSTVDFGYNELSMDCQKQFVINGHSENNALSNDIRRIIH